LSRHLSLEKTPDVLVLPSDLQPFARVVGDNVDTAAADKDDKRFVAVNPGRLAKGNIGGTLAHVYVSEGAPEPGASGVQAHSVHSRARVDIVRI
jgi:DNA polymerase alpha subunit B